LLQLYTESMTFTHSTADVVKFNKAVAALNTLDTRRGNNHLSTFKNTVKMINDSFRKS